jgi:multidrug resistance efflux pump
MANVETKVKGSSRELLAVQGGDVKTAEELRLTAYDLEESDKLLEDACIAFIPTPHRAETVKARIRMAEARTKIAGARIRMAEARITMAEARVKKAEARIEEAEAEAQFKKARPLNN